MVEEGDNGGEKEFWPKYERDQRTLVALFIRESMIH